MPVGSVALDIGKLEAKIVQAAMKGGAKAADQVLERAKARAPVRKLFKGTGYRQGVSVRNSQGTVGFNGRQPRIRQLRYQDESGEVNQVRGHANSLVPLFRTKSKANGTSYLSGDFRLVEGPKGFQTLRTVEADEAVMVKGGKVKQLTQRDYNAEELRTKGGRLTTSGGRYEIASGRANFRDPGSRLARDGTKLIVNPRQPQTRVGGRLRGELHVEGPVRGEIIWWYIVSRTKDRGRLYGRDQEFGNRHTPAHPFLRPALHESRDLFRNQVRSNIKEAARPR